MTAKSYNKQPKKDIYQEATDKVLALMEEYGTDWVKEWSGSGLTVPYNLTTENNYNGFNIIALSMETASNDYPTNIWGGYGQLKKAGLQVNKGEHGTHIIRLVNITKEDDKGKEYSFPILKTLTVFNISQTNITEEKLESLLPTSYDNQDERNAVIDTFIEDTGVSLSHGGDRAFYRPATDSVTMPLFSSFSSSESYYSTLLHELTHWTGNKDRLDRKHGNGFGTEGYAKEELIAELGAVFLGMNLGLITEPLPNHAKYLNGWLKALKNDKKFIVQASSQAEKATQYLLGLQEENNRKLVA